MAGTNKNLSVGIQSLAPAIILVRPQLGENIGMCARAMLNCAVTELRIVKPRDGWPNEDAHRACSGADSVLDNAKIFDTTQEAIADLEYILATTARGRGLTKDILALKDAAETMRGINGDREVVIPTLISSSSPPRADWRVAGEGEKERTQKCGILFGPERTGLENDEVALANAILHIPLNPGFSSLNLAQAVLLTCHAWLCADNPFAEIHVGKDAKLAAPAPKAEVETLLAHLEDELHKAGFFRSPDQRPTILRNIRNFFFRSAPTQQDVRTLHGIFSSLTGKRSWK